MSNLPAIAERDALRIFETGDDCYSYHVRTFTTWLRERELPLDLTSVADYFRELNESDYAAGTIRMKRQAVKNRLRRLADSGDIDANTAFKFDRLLRRLDTDPDTKAPKMQKAAIGANKVMTQPEYLRVLEAATDRQRAFTAFLWATGCRVSEMTGAKVVNCKRDGSTVYVRIMGKGKKQRTVRITAALFDEIRSTFDGKVYLFETRTGKAYRRQYVSEQIAKLCLRTIGRRLSAHKLRHSFATRIMERTGKLQAVSQYLGHSTTAITADMYVHQSLDDSELFEVAI